MGISRAFLPGSPTMARRSLPSLRTVDLTRHEPTAADSCWKEERYVWRRGPKTDRLDMTRHF